MVFSRQGEKKGRPLSRLGFHPYPPAVALDDALAHGQADPGSGVLFLAVETLEDLEKATKVPGLDADAVVADFEKSETVILEIVLRADVN